MSDRNGFADSLQDKIHLKLIQLNLKDSIYNTFHIIKQGFPHFTTMSLIDEDLVLVIGLHQLWFWCCDGRHVLVGLCIAS